MDSDKCSGSIISLYFPSYCLITQNFREVGISVLLSLLFHCFKPIVQFHFIKNGLSKLLPKDPKYVTFSKFQKLYSHDNSFKLFSLTSLNQFIPVFIVSLYFATEIGYRYREFSECLSEHIFYLAVSSKNYYLSKDNVTSLFNINQLYS